VAIEGQFRGKFLVRYSIGPPLEPQQPANTIDNRWTLAKLALRKATVVGLSRLRLYTRIVKAVTSNFNGLAG
jgi:hypothetical protein